MRFTVPKVPGKYPVGTTTFAVPISAADDQTRIVGNATLKASSGAKPGTPALKLEEVAFTAYYPTDISSTHGPSRTAAWVPRPVHDTLKGYAHFAGLGIFHKLLIFLFGSLARLFKFSAYPNAGLLDPKYRSDVPGQPWPLVIFSHGLAGTRTSYTYLCARLASQGKVVLALEHRDGSGPFVFTRSPIPGSGEKDGAEAKFYLNPEDVEVNTKETKNRFAFRNEQLLFRRLEIYFAYTAFKHFVNSKCDTSLDRPDAQRMHTVGGPWNFKLQNRQEDYMFWQSWEPSKDVSKVQCDRNICLAGHSFGAATLLTLLCYPPPLMGDQKLPSIPVTHALALDPWVEPLPSPGPSPLAVEASLSDHPHVPPELLVINSEAFTVWDGHFPQLQEIVNVWNNSTEDQVEGLRARLLTIVRCRHVSFSDFPIFFAFGHGLREAYKFLETISELSLSFLDGDLQSALQRQSKASGETETIVQKGGSKEQRVIGNAGDVVVHT